MRVSNVEGGDSCTALQPLAVTDRGVVQESRQGLEEKAGAPLIMERFRPNVVVSGAPAWAEDLWSEVAIGGSEGSVTLKLVKPCSRCSIPDVDPTTGAAPPCAYHLPAPIHSRLGFTIVCAAMHPNKLQECLLCQPSTCRLLHVKLLH
jgi:hypothetical protein